MFFPLVSVTGGTEEKMRVIPAGVKPMTFGARLFKHYIAPSTGITIQWITHWVIHMIEIYPVDSIIPPLFNYRGQVTSPDVLPLSFRRLVGAKVTKLGSCHLSQISSCQFL